MPLSDRRKAMIKRVSKAHFAGDHITTKDCKEFLKATEDVEFLLFAFGDRYHLVAVDLLRMRSDLQRWVDARER